MDQAERTLWGRIEAWHLHLLYTRSHWGEFCPEALGQALQHGPTKGDDAERDKLDDCYGRTKESYERLYGHAPPEDVWPPASIRFATGTEQARVRLSRNWIVTGPFVRVAAAAACAVFLIAGCVPVLASSAGDWFGGAIFLFVVGTPFLMVILNVRDKRKMRDLRRRIDAAEGLEKKRLRKQLHKLFKKHLRRNPNGGPDWEDFGDGGFS